MKYSRPALALYAAPALFVALLPATHASLLYDRAAILRGEWWRLWTGHWVHFSPSHFGWNLAVLLAAGTWLERLQPGMLIRFSLVGAPLISLGLFALTPALQAYGGLSGLATGVVVLLALAQLESYPADRGWWLALLGLVAGKIAGDSVGTAPLFSRFDPDVYHPSALAHALGALLAVPVFLSRWSALHAPLGQPAP